MCVIALQLEQALRLDSGDGDHDSLESRSLAQHNVELRRRLDEEQAQYKRKLTAYQEGQQRQAQLVQKLQAKVPQRTGPAVSFSKVSLFISIANLVAKRQCKVRAVV